MKSSTYFKLCSVVFLFLGLAAHAEAKKWRLKEECTLIPNMANDGDSFHVRWHKREYIFRLLFVDCPETDMSIPERVREQAAYWGITPEQAVQVGKDAAKFSADFLKNGFSLYTQFDDARGRSDKDRDYAIVLVGEQYLMEALVANGLARIHGLQEMPPEGISLENMRMRLNKAENDAKKNKLGAWAFAKNASSSQPVVRPSWERPTQPAIAPTTAPVVTPTVSVPASIASSEFQEQTITIQKTTAVYSLKAPYGQVGYLTPGKEVTILKEESPSMMRVRFKASEDKVYEAQCYRLDLGL